MIKNKAAFTISKKINRLYRENYKKTSSELLLFGRFFLRSVSQAFGCFKVLKNDQFERAFLKSGQDRTGLYKM